MRKQRPKLQPRLINHRDIAKLIGVSTEVLIQWVGVGEFPEPIAVVRRTWLYPVDLIESWIRTGQWDGSAKFKRGLGKGRISMDGEG